MLWGGDIRPQTSLYPSLSGVTPWLSLGPPAPFPPGSIWRWGLRPMERGHRVLRAERRRAGWGRLACWAVSFLRGPGPGPRPPSPECPQPSAPSPPRPRPVASPFYSGLQPPLEGGAWLKVMAGCLPARGLSTDPPVPPAPPNGGGHVGVNARQLPRSPDGPECKHCGIRASLAALPDTGFLQGILEVASCLVRC